MIMLNETDYADPVTGTAALPTSSSLPGESGFIGSAIDYNGPPPCTGCGQAILDQFILKVQGRLWHAACLRCAACHLTLTRDCFVRGSQVFCQDDFFRLFGARCTGCNQHIPPTDQVRRAHEKVYHQSCFRCLGCDAELNTGDEFFLRDDGKLICRHDYDIAKEKEDSDSGSEQPSPKRTRIYISDDQISALKIAYERHRLPSRQTLEKLSQDIDLHLKVVQSWFQNKRDENKRQDDMTPWIPEGEISHLNGSSMSNKTGSFPVPIVNKEFCGNFAVRDEQTNQLGGDNQCLDKNKDSHWSMSDDMWSGDFVPPNIELTPEDIKDGEVCSSRNRRKSTGRDVTSAQNIQPSSTKKCLTANIEWVDCLN